jgi:uncharacterized cupin superfamily protein
MPEPTTPIFFCRCAFTAPPGQLFAALDEDQAWAQALGGTPLDAEPGVRIRLAHLASGGILEAAIAPRGQGSRLTISLRADALDRTALDGLAASTSAVFDALEARLERAADDRLPDAWPAVYQAPALPARILRRADYEWTPSNYPDAPEDTMGTYADLTRRLGVTQFGADVHRLEPGERNCRNHVELHEQEAFLVLSGSCQIEVEGQVYPLETGDLCVTFPGEAHFFCNLGDRPCEVLCFGGPDLFGSGAAYPHGRDDAWRERLETHLTTAR